ncbi:MAG: hypothetical protein ACLQAT_22600 [Candidatus Binataceae bacterium]
MPAKKKTAPKKKPAPKKTAAKKRSSPSAGSSQLTQLRGMVSQLRKRIEQETKARKLDSRLVTEAKKARDQVTKQVTALRDQGKKLASQLASTLTDAKKREQARQEALAVVAELRAELERRTDELKRKTLELRDLAAESAQKARDIIQSEAPEPAPAEPKPGSSEGGETQV